MKMPMARATRVAATVRPGLRVLMGFFGLMTGSWAGHHRPVRFFGAGAESAAVQAGRMLNTMRVGDAYNRYALSLPIDDRVSRVIDLRADQLPAGLRRACTGPSCRGR
jgi:hypothetical protein